MSDFYDQQIVSCHYNKRSLLSVLQNNSCSSRRGLCHSESGRPCAGRRVRSSEVHPRSLLWTHREPVAKEARQPARPGRLREYSEANPYALTPYIIYCIPSRPRGFSAHVARLQRARFSVPNATLGAHPPQRGDRFNLRSKAEHTQRLATEYMTKGY